jgi:hypothetical protein
MNQTSNTAGSSDLDLLRIEIEIWTGDERMQAHGPDLVIACSSLGSAAHPGP